MTQALLNIATKLTKKINKPPHTMKTEIKRYHFKSAKAVLKEFWRGYENLKPHRKTTYKKFLDREWREYISFILLGEHVTYEIAEEADKLYYK